MFKALTNWISSMFATHWFYRIRYQADQNRWTIETNTHGQDPHQWISIGEPKVEANNQPVAILFESYSAAMGHVEASGINLAYVEKRYNNLPRPANMQTPPPHPERLSDHVGSGRVRSLSPRA